MANWLQGWDYDSSSSSSGLGTPTKKQVTDAGLLYATWMFPMTRMGSAATAWLVRQGAKRVVPPSGLDLVKTALLTNTPVGAFVQMAKGTGYRVLGHKMGIYNPLSQSSEGSSPSYQQNGSSGGKPSKKKVSRAPKPTWEGLRQSSTWKDIQSMWENPANFSCPKGWKPVYRNGKMMCVRR